MMGVFLFLYILANFVVYFYVGWHLDKMFNNGFYVKHLVVGILFFPATLGLIAMLIIGLIIVGIWEGIKKLFKANFFNKRLF